MEKGPNNEEFVMEAKESNDFYSKKDFWNDRFQSTEGFFDWYVGYEELKSLFTKLTTNESKILMVGCGNSKLSESVYKNISKDILNIDISDVVIQKMNDHYKETHPEMKFIEMDATNMSLESNSFDLVFDKGTLDALMCDKELVLPKKLIQEMLRVTKINKQFVIITYGEPKLRLNFFMKSVNGEDLSEANAECEVEKIDLSILSNLINSMRNRSKDGAIKSVIKDQEALIHSLIDVYDSKINDPEADQQTRKKFICLKIIALSKLKTMKEKNQNNQKVNQQENNEENGATKEKQTIYEMEKNLDERTEEQKEQGKKRRTHCFAYVFKKLK